jgi:hypothetical protein
MFYIQYTRPSHRGLEVNSHAAINPYLAPCGSFSRSDGTRRNAAKALLMVSFVRFSQALDGTPWGLSLHGNQWFRLLQYVHRLGRNQYLDLEE